MHQARPKVGLGIMPGVELDLDDALMERRIASSFGRLPARFGEIAGRLLDHPHVLLAGPPWPEHGDR